MAKQKDKPELEELTAIYSQEDDCCHLSDFGRQDIEISTHDGGGGGIYYTIKTDRWAFDSIEEITTLINNFIKKTK